MFTMMKRGYPYPLTPSCLIYGCRTTTSSNDSQYEMVTTNEYLMKRTKHHRKSLNEFGKQWRREYLLSIRKSTRASNNGVEDAIAVGDIVVLKNESTKRIFWKTAKVEELIRSVDAVVRSVKIRVVNSDNRRSIIMQRPILRAETNMDMDNDASCTIPRPLY